MQGQAVTQGVVDSGSVSLKAALQRMGVPSAPGFDPRANQISLEKLPRHSIEAGDARSSPCAVLWGGRGLHCKQGTQEAPRPGTGSWPALLSHRSVAMQPWDRAAGN